MTASTQNGRPDARMFPTLRYIREVTYKPRDAWWTVFVVDPIASRVLWLLVRVHARMSPMTVTTASLVLGVAAAVLFAQGQMVLAAVTYQVSFLADAMDGKLARLTGRASLLGAFYDGLTNHVVYVTALMGLTVWALGTGQGWTAAGALALVGIRVLTTHANPFVPRPTKNWASAFAGTDTSPLARRRLLPPFSFPDKHLVLFLLGPVTGFLWVGIVVNLLLEVALFGRKLHRIVPALSGQEHGQDQSARDASLDD